MSKLIPFLSFFLAGSILAPDQFLSFIAAGVYRLVFKFGERSCFNKHYRGVYARGDVGLGHPMAA